MRFHLPKQAAISIILLCAAPLLAGVRNLNASETARLIDFYMVIPGMLLFLPVFLPEQDYAIRDLIRSEYTSLESIYLLRILMDGLVMLALTGAFLTALQIGNCQFPFLKYFLAAICGMLFLGGLGVLAYAWSDQPVIGYMAPFGYYLFALGSGEKYLGNWYLFSLVSGSYTEKYYLAVSGILLLTAGVGIRGVKDRI